MAVGRLKVWNYVTGAWEYVAPGLMGPTGPAGATGPAGGVGATGPMASVRTLDVTSGTITPNVNSYDLVVFTGTGSVTIANPTGTPTHGQKLMIQLIAYPDPITSITFGNKYATLDPNITFPTTSSGGYVLGFMYQDGPGAYTGWVLIAKAGQ